MKPQKGEFWIVEFLGKVTVGHCYSAGATTDLWELIGRDFLIDSTREDFRAVRKLDIAALLDQPARPKTIAEHAEEVRGLYRMLWLVVKSAGAPGGVTIDRDAIASFNPMTAELHSSTHPVTGEVHVEARGGR